MHCVVIGVLFGIQGFLTDGVKGVAWGGFHRVE